MFKRALAIKDDIAEYHFNLGVAFRTQEKFDEAIPEYERAVALDRSLVQAWWDLGVSYRANHDNPKAIEAFQAYLNLVKGKDAAAESAGAGAIEALGGKVEKKSPKKKQK
jgi:tetratricopeptide (TPR) repeat protein